jgi:hypothetical protein
MLPGKTFRRLLQALAMAVLAAAVAAGFVAMALILVIEVERVLRTPPLPAFPLDTAGYTGPASPAAFPSTEGAPR